MAGDHIFAFLLYPSLAIALQYHYKNEIAFLIHGYIDS